MPEKKSDPNKNAERLIKEVNEALKPVEGQVSLPPKEPIKHLGCHHVPFLDANDQLTTLGDYMHKGSQQAVANYVEEMLRSRIQTIKALLAGAVHIMLNELDREGFPQKGSFAEGICKTPIMTPVAIRFFAELLDLLEPVVNGLGADLYCDNVDWPDLSQLEKIDRPENDDGYYSPIWPR